MCPQAYLYKMCKVTKNRPKSQKIAKNEKKMTQLSDYVDKNSDICSRVSAPFPRAPAYKVIIRNNISNN